MVKIKCSACDTELQQQPAILTGPPDVNGRVRQLPLCRGCWNKVYDRTRLRNVRRVVDGETEVSFRARPAGNSIVTSPVARAAAQAIERGLKGAQLDAVIAEARARQPLTPSAFVDRRQRIRARVKHAGTPPGRRNSRAA